MLKKFTKKAPIILFAMMIAIVFLLCDSVMAASGTKAALKKVKNYISRQEDLCISDTVNHIDYGIVYDDYFDALTFAVISYTDDSFTDHDFILRLDAPSDMKGTADVSIAFNGNDYKLFATAKFELSKSKSSKALKFKISGSDGNDYSSSADTQNGFRGIFDTGMALWDKCLYDNTGYHLKSIGFKKYKISKDTKRNVKEVFKTVNEREYNMDPVGYPLVRIGDGFLCIVLADNSSAEAFFEKIKKDPLVIDMQDYGGFEKVGELPWELPVNDEKTGAKPGDIIIYQGNKLAICYGENTSDFTKIGYISCDDADELKAVLGDGDVTAEFFVEWTE